MVLGADAPADAGLLAAAGVQAEDQVVTGVALGVHVVDDLLHAVREVVLLRVREAGGVALLGGPAVVEVERAVAGLVQTDLHEGIGGGLDGVGVAVVEHWVVVARAEGDPAGPAEGGEAAVRGAVVESLR